MEKYLFSLTPKKLEAELMLEVFAETHEEAVAVAEKKKAADAEDGTRDHASLLGRRDVSAARFFYKINPGCAQSLTSQTARRIVGDLCEVSRFLQTRGTEMNSTVTR